MSMRIRVSFIDTLTGSGYIFVVFGRLTGADSSLCQVGDS
jgi:hypothetical protein